MRNHIGTIVSNGIIRWPCDVGGRALPIFRGSINIGCGMRRVLRMHRINWLNRGIDSDPMSVVGGWFRPPKRTKGWWWSSSNGSKTKTRSFMGHEVRRVTCSTTVRRSIGLRVF